LLGGVNLACQVVLTLDGCVFSKQIFLILKKKKTQDNFWENFSVNLINFAIFLEEFANFSISHPLHPKRRPQKEKPLVLISHISFAKFCTSAKYKYKYSVAYSLTFGGWKFSDLWDSL